ncbi:hypothetical protein L2E82_32792 [Cichorium intybus]|uniref:Uncharacterized protein n=1 Tax=Cichorium intybus TaxID=13427 RepID=A0ACB9BHE2_CICIN|nr:hypothetical protein L2E82_32792 [Cichorium intybus]
MAENTIANNKVTTNLLAVINKGALCSVQHVMAKEQLQIWEAKIKLNRLCLRNIKTEEHMRTLRKELEVLKNEVTKAEAATAVVEKKYDEISKRERELQPQFRTADYMSGREITHKIESLICQTSACIPQIHSSSSWCVQSQIYFRIPFSPNLHVVKAKDCYTQWVI